MHRVIQELPKWKAWLKPRGADHTNNNFKKCPKTVDQKLETSAVEARPCFCHPATAHVGPIHMRCNYHFTLIKRFWFTSFWLIKECGALDSKSRSSIWAAKVCPKLVPKMEGQSRRSCCSCDKHITCPCP